MTGVQTCALPIYFAVISLVKMIFLRSGSGFPRDSKVFLPITTLCSNVVFLKYCRDEREIFIIGGGEIFKQTLPFADRVLLTRLHTTIDGDAYFPELPAHEWTLESEDKHEKDEKHAFDYSFQVYVRK